MYTREPSDNFWRKQRKASPPLLGTRKPECISLPLKERSRVQWTITKAGKKILAPSRPGRVGQMTLAAMPKDSWDSSCTGINISPEDFKLQEQVQYQEGRFPLSHAQHMLVPFLSTKGKLMPYLGLAIPKVLIVYLLPSWGFPLQSSPHLFQNFMFPPSSPSSPCQGNNNKKKAWSQVSREDN